MAPRNKEGPPVEEPAGLCALAGTRSDVVQDHDRAAGHASVATVSGTSANAVAFNGWSGKGEKLLSLWKILGRATRDQALSKGDIAVLYAIAERVNDSNVAWPGFDRLAIDTGVHRSTVVRSVERLEACGHLQRQSGGIGKANRYRLTSGADATRSADATGGVHATGSADATGGVHATEGVASTLLGVVAPTLPESASLNLLQESVEEHVPEPPVPGRSNEVQRDQSDSATSDTGPGIAIPLKDGSRYSVTSADVELLTKTHPGKDVLQRLREAGAWAETNPTRRKTRAGVRKFLSSWVAREFASPPAGQRKNDYFQPSDEKFANFEGGLL